MFAYLVYQGVLFVFPLFICLFVCFVNQNSTTPQLMHSAYPFLHVIKHLKSVYWLLTNFLHLWFVSSSNRRTLQSSVQQN